jgi:hypothetical protein
LGRAWYERQSYYVAQCSDCGEMLLYVNLPAHDDICDTFEGTEEAETVLVWPELAVSSATVPQRVRECYDEAVAVRKRSRNSCATNIRRALEAVCDDRGIAKAPLNKRKQSLAFRGELSPRLIEITDVLRFVGNVGAHSDRDVTEQEVEVIERCFRLVIDYFYEVPEKIRQLKQTLAGITNEQLGESSDEDIGQSTKTENIQ